MVVGVEVVVVVEGVVADGGGVNPLLQTEQDWKYRSVLSSSSSSYNILLSCSKPSCIFCLSSTLPYEPSPGKTPTI